MRSDVIISFINLLLYVIAFIKFRSRSLLGTGSLIFILYSFFAVMSLFVVVSAPYNYYHLNIFALIYLFVCIVLTYKPLSTLNRETIQIIPPKRKALNFLLTIIAIFSIIRLPNIITNFQMVILGFLADSNVFYDTYMNSMESYHQVENVATYNFFTIITNMFDRYIPLFLMYYLTIKDRNKWLVIGLLVGLILAPMYGLINAQRGAIVDTILASLLAYSLFHNAYEEKIKKYIHVIGFTVGLAAVLALAVITVSRFSQQFMDDDMVKTSVFSYAGQAMVNFGQYGFDTGGLRYGDRTIPLFKRLVSSDVAYDYAHRMDKYTNLNLPESIFSTYIGDLVVDFGAIVTFFLIFFIMLIMKKTISFRGNTIEFYKIIPAYMLGYLIVCGWHLFPFADFGGNLSLIIGFLLYIFFKIYKEIITE